ncbi:MAG: redoxin family protein [Pirellulaceae bacterium]|nr:redoxin family protein [Pirellulaceae bacterium]
MTIGSPAPAIDIEHWISNGEGRFKPVQKFSPGKVYVIEFWATWCGPCVRSIPQLAALQQRYADQGLQIISVSNEDRETVDQFLQRTVVDSKDETTYAKLTSAYCLTTDPDGSVQEDYMVAAAQSGIPTAFLIGKDGVIEWIGLPSDIDEPIQKVLQGTWDRAAARAAIVAEQRRMHVQTAIGQAMSRGNVDAALKIIAQAKIDYADDRELVELLNFAEIQVRVFPATRLAMEGKIDESLKMLEELKASSPSQQQEITEIQFSVLLHGQRFDAAAKTLDAIVAKESDAEKLNAIAWSLYEAASDTKDFSESLLAAATRTASKSIQLAPHDATAYDTHAHLLHRQGQRDAAIEAQTRAVELADETMREEYAAFLEQMKAEKTEAQ